MINNLLKSLEFKSNSEKAKLYSRFFKTGKGEYGEGDIFLGLSIPEQREISKRYSNLSFAHIQKLLNSKIHEHRMVGGIILTLKAEKNPEDVFNFYLKNLKKFNNWDLVDMTCIKILGNFLLDKSQQRKILYNLAKSNNLWERRIAIVSTLSFIKNDSLGETLRISEILLKDKHDLIQKANGWMLRELGKKNKKVLLDFIKIHYKDIPRTTLRYAIEKFPEKQRKEILRNNLSSFN